MRMLPSSILWRCHTWVSITLIFPLTSIIYPNSHCYFIHHCYHRHHLFTSCSSTKSGQSCVQHNHKTYEYAVGRMLGNLVQIGSTSLQESHLQEKTICLCISSFQNFRSPPLLCNGNCWPHCFHSEKNSGGRKKTQPFQGPLEQQGPSWIEEFNLHQRYLGLYMSRIGHPKKPLYFQTVHQ